MAAQHDVSGIWRFVWASGYARAIAQLELEDPVPEELVLEEPLIELVDPGVEVL